MLVAWQNYVRLPELIFAVQLAVEEDSKFLLPWEFPLRSPLKYLGLARQSGYFYWPKLLENYTQQNGV